MPAQALDREKATTVHQEFRRVVNMAPRALEKWLETEASKSVGQKRHPDDESVGHASGRRIVKLLRTRQADLTASDEKHMQKVVGYVHRHLAQRPKKNVEHSRWRYSLMNWGHDPLK